MKTAHVAVLAVAAATLALPLRAQDRPLEDFEGVYVGTATVSEPGAGVVEERDVDMVIEPYRGDGLRIDWVNVSKIDGRRDVPGVERREQTVLLESAGRDGMLLRIEEPNLFRKAPEMQPMSDPIQWAAIDGDSLDLYSFVVDPEAGYEFQIYAHTLTPTGLDISFERIVDGVVTRTIDGSTVRVPPR